MSLKSWVIAQGILALLKDANKKGLIIDLAQKIDAVSDKDLASNSERVQAKVVEVVLLPLCRELLKENPVEFNRLITDAIVDMPNEKEETPERGNHGNFGPKNRS